MQGTIFQILVLVTHGNLAISNQQAENFYPQHSAFKFDEYVKFVDLEKSNGKWQEIPFAENPNEWISKLKTKNCSGLRVERISTDNDQISDRMSVAFVGGGGRWVIEAVCPDGSDFWEAKWEIGNQNDPNQKIWQVTYGLIAKNQKANLLKPLSTDELSREFKTTLQDALIFSKKHNLEGFANSFNEALLSLDSSVEPNLYGVAQNGQLPIQASKLIAAAQSAWVFGGMGSWNDLGFDGDDQKEYENISERLFLLINNSLVSSTNLSYPKPVKQWWQLWK